MSLKAMKGVIGFKEKIAAAENLPNLFAFGNYHMYHGMDSPPFDIAWRQGYLIGFGLKINLFDGNLTKGKVKEVRANIDKISGYEENYRLQIKNKYVISAERINSLNSQKISALSNLEVANKANEIAKVGYKNGVITTIELNETELNITRVKAGLLGIEKDLLLEEATIHYLMGRI
jgi:outer membrane protein TolC